jgi:hypothetical protein
MGSPCCLCIPPSPSTNQLLNARSYILAPEPISYAYFINPSHQSVYPSVVATQQFGEHGPVATNTLSTRRIVRSAVFYAVPVLS